MRELAGSGVAGHMGTHFLKLLALLLQLLQGPESGFLLLQVREDMTVKAGERWGSGGQWKSPGRAGARTNLVEGAWATQDQ